MFVILTVRDNCPDEIKGVHHDADAAYKAFKAYLREAFQGEPLTEDDLDAACELGYEPWGNGFIAILDLSNAEADNPNPLRQLLADVADSYEDEGCDGCGTVDVETINRVRVAVGYPPLETAD